MNVTLQQKPKKKKCEMLVIWRAVWEKTTLQTVSKSYCVSGKICHAYRKIVDLGRSGRVI